MHLATLRDDQLPLTLGRFELQAELGSGGMARVFRAEMIGDLGFRRPIALKVVLEPEREDAAERSAQLIQEARLGGLLNHPNVAQVFDCGLLEGHPYIAMELVDGVGLDELIERTGALSWQAAAALIIQACRGLQHAHDLREDGRRLGLVHRDIKPSNVMVRPDGVVKIVDFGIAKARLTDSIETSTGITKGTPLYMAPEQLEGNAVDPRTDLFALGTLLHQLLSGRALFRAGSLPATVLRIMKVDELLEKEGILDRTERLRPGLGAVLRRTLRRAPDERYRSARELRRALEDVCGDLRPEVLMGRVVRKHFPERFESHGTEQLAEDKPALEKTAPLGLSVEELRTATPAEVLAPTLVPQAVSPPIVASVGLRAVVVDDEPLGRGRIIRLLADHPDVQVVAEAANGTEARAAVLQHRPDVLFLDVDMPGEDGVSALRILRGMLPEQLLPAAVFTTAHPEHAVAAFELEGADYLLKPISREGLARAMKRVRKSVWERRPPGSSPAPIAPLPTTPPATVGIESPAPAEEDAELGEIPGIRAGRTYGLRITEVALVFVEDTITFAVTPGGRFRLKPSLQEMEEQLPGPPFFRVSRSALLNLRWLESLEPQSSGRWSAILKAPIEERVDVSRRRGKELRDHLGW